jgi:hypothetical protein
MGARARKTARPRARRYVVPSTFRRRDAEAARAALRARLPAARRLKAQAVAARGPAAMNTTVVQLIFVAMSLLVFVGTVAFQLWGRHYAAKRPDQPSGLVGAGSSAIEASVFALLGLLVAFSFSGSEVRLQNRRELTVREANALGTAYLRLELLPEPARASIKEQMRRYTDTRIAFYKRIGDFSAARAAIARAERLQQSIWDAAVEASARAPDARVALVVLPALNETFDTATARDAALHMHIPAVIFVFLGVLALACAFLAGMDMASVHETSPLHVLIFGATMALTAYTVLNIEFPLAGFLRLESLNSLFEHLRTTMR